METNDTYLTLSRPSEGLYKEKGSKFLAFAYPVFSEEDIKERLEELRKKFYDARHHCYAYMLGLDQAIFRANDDGEPNHSAGDPILGQIKANNLTNVLIVVIRYFGGTKLGVGGLIQAYKTAAAEAISSGEIITEIVKKQMTLTFDYLAMNDVMRLIKEEELEILNQNFDNQCQIILVVRASKFDAVTTYIQDLDQVAIID